MPIRRFFQTAKQFRACSGLSINVYPINFESRMKYIFVIFYGFLLLTSCEPSKPKLFDVENPSFQTYSDTELFFKNVRQIYYQLEDQAPTKLKLYRLKRQNTKTQDRPIINLTLVHNWRYNEAYLLLEPNAFFENSGEFTVQWKNPANEENGKIQFERGNKKTLLKFAYLLYQKLKEDAQFWVVQQDKEYPLLADKQEREAFRVSMADYLRLIAAEN